MNDEDTVQVKKAASKRKSMNAESQRLSDSAHCRTHFSQLLVRLESKNITHKISMNTLFVFSIIQPKLKNIGLARCHPEVSLSVQGFMV